VICMRLRLIGRSIDYEPYRMTLVPDHRMFGIRQTKLSH
jgi:hypothetical protein